MTLLEGPAMKALLDWYAREGRQYPWTGIRNPWGVWVSEIMLQQTTVAAVENRYEAWMKKYPSPRALAEAPEEDLLREWEGLGYYNRARNLAAAARELTSSYGGKIPSDSKTLQSFPGVGPYVASAVASFAFGERCAALDANGKRLAQRLSGTARWNRGLEEAFRAAVERCMTEADSGTVNSAIMQLGQQVCTPRNARCEHCPLKEWCRAFGEGMQDAIPMRKQKNTIRKKTALALLVREGRVLLEKKESGIGRGLWVFPPADIFNLRKNEWEKRGLLGEEGDFVHYYTRYREVLRPEVYVPVNEANQSEKPVKDVSANPENRTRNLEWVSMEKLSLHPMPSVYRRIAGELTQYMNHEATTCFQPG